MQFRRGQQNFSFFYVTPKQTLVLYSVFLMGNLEHCPILLQISCHPMAGPTPKSCHINVKVGRLFRNFFFKIEDAYSWNVKLKYCFNDLWPQYNQTSTFCISCEGAFNYEQTDRILISNYIYSLSYSHLINTSTPQFENFDCHTKRKPYKIWPLNACPSHNLTWRTCTPSFEKIWERAPFFVLIWNGMTHLGNC